MKRRGLRTVSLLGCMVLLALGSGCGSDEGTTQPPGAPAAIGATPGTYTDKVYVEWTPSAGATSYEVWRSTVNNASSGRRMGISYVVGWSDLAATPLAVSWYFVRAVNADGVSGFSAGAMGWRGATGGSTSGSANICVINDFRLTQTVYIDEVNVGTVTPGSRRTFPVSPGTHRVRAWDSVTGSVSDTITLRSGETVNWRVFGTMSLARVAESKSVEIVEDEGEVTSDE